MFCILYIYIYNSLYIHIYLSSIYASLDVFQSFNGQVGDGNFRWFVCVVFAHSTSYSFHKNKGLFKGKKKKKSTWEKQEIKCKQHRIREQNRCRAQFPPLPLSYTGSQHLYLQKGPAALFGGRGSTHYLTYSRNTFMSGLLESHHPHNSSTVQKKR